MIFDGSGMWDPTHFQEVCPVNAKLLGTCSSQSQGSRLWFLDLANDRRILNRKPTLQKTEGNGKTEEADTYFFSTSKGE